MAVSIFNLLVCMLFFNYSSFCFAQTATPTPSAAMQGVISNSPLTPSAQAQSLYLTNCDWCYGHFSFCHQPTTAPDSVIYTQCYCDTFFQAVYSTCLNSCGWESAGIPPLTAILQTCSGGSGNENASPTPTPAGGNNGGNSPGTATVAETAKGSPKATSMSNTGGANAQSTTSAGNDDDKDKSLVYRVQGVLVAGFVMGWMFGWL